MPLYEDIRENMRNGQKMLAVLIDPDRVKMDELKPFVVDCEEKGVDFIFVGGSLILSTILDDVIRLIKTETNLPVLLFPGSPEHISDEADGLLYLSLISGRNPEYLIGNHVLSAMKVKRSSLEIMPTGYMLIDGGSPTSVSYISNTTPIPKGKNDIAVSTAVAGEMLGMKLIYMDAGSGAHSPISAGLISEVKKEVEIPLIVGGGMRKPEEVANALRAGADIAVVGNALEKDSSLLIDMAIAVKEIQNETDCLL